MAITWEELSKQISNMEPDRRKDTATVYDSADEEWHAISGVQKADKADVLDEGHSYLVMREDPCEDCNRHCCCCPPCEHDPRYAE